MLTSSPDGVLGGQNLFVLMLQAWFWTSVPRQRAFPKENKTFFPAVPTGAMPWSREGFARDPRAAGSRGTMHVGQPGKREVQQPAAIQPSF